MTGCQPHFSFWLRVARILALLASLLRYVPRAAQLTAATIRPNAL